MTQMMTRSKVQILLIPVLEQTAAQSPGTVNADLEQTAAQSPGCMLQILELASLRERVRESSTEASPPTARYKARSAKTAAFGRKTMHRKEKKALCKGGRIEQKD